MSITTTCPFCHKPIHRKTTNQNVFSVLGGGLGALTAITRRPTTGNNLQPVQKLLRIISTISYMANVAGLIGLKIDRRRTCYHHCSKCGKLFKH